MSENAGASGYPIEKIRRLRRKNETWQGGIIRFPRWLAEPGQKPLRPWLPVWVNVQTMRVNTGSPKRPEEKSAEMLLEAMEVGQGMVGTRPAEVQVSDPALAEFLKKAFEGMDTEVVLVERLEALEKVVEHLKQQADPFGLPDALSATGVTRNHLRALAEAAKKFYEAEPWTQLTDDDVIRVESPEPPDASLKFLTVLGAAGVARGIGMYRSPEQHAELQAATDMRKFYRKHGGVWTVLFQEITQLPMGDADFFEDEEVPVAGLKGYPMARQYNAADNLTRRPDGMTIAYLEGLLRALGETSEGEMDTGRWTKRVTTVNGEAEYVLALPALLGEGVPDAQPVKMGPTPVQMRQMERALDRLDRIDLDRQFASSEEAAKFLRENFKENEDVTKAETPLEHAQDLVDQATMTKGRRSRQLVRKALELCPDCADAYQLLAYREPDLEKARGLFEEAVSAAERAMGPEAFSRPGVEFWKRVETRAYLRARMGLAEVLRALNKPEEAAEHFQQMLQLNPADQQGVRYRLMATLLDLKRDDALEELISRFGSDKTALWLYGKALWMFRKQGDTNLARQAAVAALEANLVASNYLLKKKDLPAKPPTSFTAGSESEAIVVAFELRGAWEGTPGAEFWLTDQRRKKRERDERGRK